MKLLLILLFPIIMLGQPKAEVSVLRFMKLKIGNPSGDTIIHHWVNTKYYADSIIQKDRTKKVYMPYRTNCEITKDCYLEFVRSLNPNEVLVKLVEKEDWGWEEKTKLRKVI